MKIPIWEEKPEEPPALRFRLVPRPDMRDAADVVLVHRDGGIVVTLLSIFYRGRHSIYPRVHTNQAECDLLRGLGFSLTSRGCLTVSPLGQDSD